MIRPAAIRTTRLLVLAGLCLGFGVAAGWGGPLVEVLANRPAFGVLGKPAELAFLIVAGTVACLAGLGGAVLARQAPEPGPRREVMAMSAVVCSALGVILLTAFPTFRVPAAGCLLLAATGMALSAASRVPPRGRRGGQALGGAIPDHPTRPGWRVWLAVAVFLGWLHHDPIMRYRNVDQLHEGQHLAWASQIRAGILPGKSLTLMYGPLYTDSLLAWMKVAGWTVMGERTYFSAAQVAGGLCAFLVLTRICITPVGALTGLGLYHLITIAALVWYGWANSLRAGLGLAAVLAAIEVLLVSGSRPNSGSVRARRGASGIPWPVRPLLAGAGLAASFCYSPESGGAALIAVAGVGLAMVWLLDARRATFLRLATIAGGWIAANVLILATLFSGSWPDRVESFLHYSANHLRGFMSLAFLPPRPLAAFTWLGLTRFVTHWSWIGWLAPVACLAVLAMVAAGRAAGKPLTPRHWHLAGVSIYGLVSLTTSLDRSDLWHFLSASPAGVLMAAAALERSVLLARAIAARADAPTAGLRAAWLGLLMPAWMLGAMFLGGYIPDAWNTNSTVWGAKRAAAAAEYTLDVAGGWRVPLDHPRSGGLIVTREQRDDLVAVLREIDRRTVAGEPIFAGPGAESLYFLADRPCPNPYPCSLQAASDQGFQRIAESLRACKVVVLSPTFLVDRRHWEQWEPAVGAVVRREFVRVWSGTNLLIGRRR